LPDDLIEVQRFEKVSRTAGAVEIAQSADDVSAIATGGIDDAQIFEGGRFIGARRGIFQQHFAVTDDRHERVAEIVDYAAGHFAKGAEALLLHGLPLRGLQIRERLFQLPGALAHAFLEQVVLLLNFEPEKVRLKKSPNAHAYFRGIERLHQEIGGAGRKRAAFVLGRRIAGENEDGDLLGLLIGAQGIEDVEAAESRHAEIEQNQIGRQRFDRVKGEGRIVYAAELTIADAIEEIRHQTGAAHLVIHHQDVRFF
jgi:hypothetical protein